MAYFATRGLRGSVFEELVDLTNTLYFKAGMALVQKIPTPIVPTKVDNRARTITQAYFGRRGTVDYIGVSDGLPICFDAKQTSTKNFPLRNIHEHQLEYMQAFSKQGGASFVLLNFSAEDLSYVLPLHFIQAYADAAKLGARKSIPLDEIPAGLRLERHTGFPVHYLPLAKEVGRGIRKVDAAQTG